ncbi:MAG TPA: bacteriohemerythrin [Candidatus Hydrogenedentes bacterium]|nr:bacteriohemerythrin [Candidatus Hydrogenedentota bacterium]HPG65213.1 bacteriohemerythrin [Candidatus Hydrogenedentota bacterium]
MGKVQWDSRLSVGIDLIDRQHQTWIDRLNNVQSAIESHQGLSHVGDMLGFLVDYTQFHFATEEKHMTALAYPDLVAHKAKHDELRETLDTLVKDFQKDGVTHPIAEAVNTLLATWLTNPIRDVDQAFGAFLKEKGVALAADGD